jgi:hypothetical protein
MPNLLQKQKLKTKCNNTNVRIYMHYLEGTIYYHPILHFHHFGFSYHLGLMLFVFQPQNKVHQM